MPKAPTLTDRALIENVGHSADKFVVVSGFAHVKSFFRRLTKLASETRRDLLIEPMVVTLHRKGSDGFPLRVILVLWFDVRHSLPQCENVRLEFCGIHQNINDKLWIAHVFVPLVLELDHGERPFCNGKGLSADFDTRNLSRLSFN